jgi:hypothetical protein
MQRHVGEPIGGVAQRVGEARVDLDHVHVRAALGEVLGEHAEAAADLEHHVLGAELGGALDHAEDVGIDEEVLSEVAVGAHVEAPHAAQGRLLWDALHARITSRRRAPHWPPPRRRAGPAGRRAARPAD